MVYLLVFAIIVSAVTIEIFKNKGERNKIRITQEDDPNFNEKYQELNEKYFSELKLLEGKKRKYKTITTIAAIISIVFISISQSDGNATETKVIAFTLAIIGLICTGILIFKLMMFNREYVKLYKTKIISAILSEVDSNLHYVDYENSTGIQKLTENDYKMAEFDKRTFNRYRGDDHIVGKLEDDSIMRMSNILVQDVTHDSDGGESTQTLFHGIFVDIEVNKNIEANIKILKDKLISFPDNAKVELDSQEFEKVFDVYADNSNVAMRILTADVMQYMLEFSNVVNYEITIIRNHIYLRFNTGEMFEPKMGKSAIDKKTLQGYFYVLKFIIGISKKINGELQQFEV